MRVAGIDIGTLTCRLLVATVSSEGPVDAIRSERKILRLGEGVLVNLARSCRAHP